MEEHNISLFIFCKNSIAVVLTLGIIIIRDEKLLTLIITLPMFKSTLPSHSFF